jgi:hypothetical protein
VWEVSLQNLPQTRADLEGSYRAFAPRALLQIFIKTTPHRRLRSFVALCFTRRSSRYFYAFGFSASLFRLSINTAAVHTQYELPLYIAIPKWLHFT